MAATEITASLDVLEDNSIESSFTLQMDPASLGLVMEEVHTATDIPWEDQIGVISDEAIIVEILLCRICAQEHTELVPVFEDEGVELQLADKIRYHLPITVSANDKLPVKVCRFCIARLNSCNELAHISLDAEEKLKKLFCTEDDKISQEANQEDVNLSTVTKQGAYRENTKRPPLPSDRLMEAMALLRKERAKRKSDAEASDGGQSNDDFDAVYLEEGFADDSEGEPVLDVTIEPVGQDSLPAVQWKTANLRVKMPKDFAECDSTLKAQIVGAIQDIMIKEDQSSSTKKMAASPLGGSTKEWKCDICGHVAPRKSSLLVHQRRNHSKSFACGYCYKTFSNSVARSAHERTHILDVVDEEVDVDNIKQEEVEDVIVKVFHCEYCAKTFKKQKSLADHTMVHHTDTKPYQCDKCGKAYATVLSLDIHRSSHSTEAPYLCDSCGKKFKHASNLRSHKRSHLLIEKRLRQVCEVCGKGFRSRFHLAEHMNVHLDRKAYACDVCGKQFHKKIQLRQHGSTHSGVQPFKCSLCGVRFNRRGNLTQHLKRHERQTKYSCKVCMQGYQTLGLLLQHRKTHTRDELDDVVRRQVLSADMQEDAYKCEICGKLLAKKESLLLHLRSHTGEKHYACDVCGKRLANKGSLTYHMRSYHTGERPYACQFCPDVFLTKEACSVHERIHTGEKPYSCHICFMGFRCSSNLAQHVRVHSDLRPFSCPHCEKSFIRKGALTVHLRTHTGERPFICDQCGRGFTQKNDMLKHRRTHTLERPFPCSVCGDTFGQKRELARHQLSHMNLQAVGEIELGEQHSEVIATSDEHQLLQGYTVEVIDSSQTLIEVLHSF